MTGLVRLNPLEINQFEKEDGAGGIAAKPNLHGSALKLLNAGNTRAVNIMSGRKEMIIEQTFSSRQSDASASPFKRSLP